MDSGIVRSLFHMDESDSLSLIEFKQVMRVHTSVMTCIERPVGKVKEEEDVVGAFDNFLSRVGCTGWSRKEYDTAYNTPERVRKPPREYSPTAFPRIPNEKEVNIDILNLNDIGGKTEKMKEDDIVDINDLNLPTLKSIKSSSERQQQKRGVCAGTSLEGNCPLM